MRQRGKAYANVSERAAARWIQLATGVDFERKRGGNTFNAQINIGMDMKRKLKEA